MTIIQQAADYKNFSLLPNPVTGNGFWLNGRWIQGFDYLKMSKYKEVNPCSKVKPEDFVRAIKEFELPEGVAPEDLTRPHANPLKAIGLAK